MEVKLRDEKLVMTVQEAANTMGLGINKMYELIHTDGFPVISVGRKKLIVKSKFEEWLENNIGQRI
jgi:excisionase family DNA binding protein